MGNAQPLCEEESHPTWRYHLASASAIRRHSCRCALRGALLSLDPCPEVGERLRRHPELLRGHGPKWPPFMRQRGDGILDRIQAAIRARLRNSTASDQEGEIEVHIER